MTDDQYNVVEETYGFIREELESGIIFIPNLFFTPLLFFSVYLDVINSSYFCRNKVKAFSDFSIGLFSFASFCLTIGWIWVNVLGLEFLLKIALS